MSRKPLHDRVDDVEAALSGLRRQRLDLVAAADRIPASPVRRSSCCCLRREKSCGTRHAQAVGRHHEARSANRSATRCGRRPATAGRRSARRRSSAPGRAHTRKGASDESVHGAKASGDIGPLAFSGKFAGGLRADIKRRAPFYWDDWIEPLRAENRGQSLAACIFLFFACLSPAVTFGMLFQDGTGGQLGVVEMLLSSGISGIFYSLFAGQPISILGATGPELAYTVVFYRMCQWLDLEFLPARCWEGLWTALFTTLLAIFDLSALMKHVTRFTRAAAHRPIFSAAAHRLDHLHRRASPRRSSRRSSRSSSSSARSPTSSRRSPPRTTSPSARRRSWAA